MLDLVDAVELARHELGVVDHLDFTRTERRGPLEPAQERLIFGDVVRRRPDPLPQLVDYLTARARDDHADRRGARIAACAAVDVHDERERVGPAGAHSPATSGSSPVTRARRRSRTWRWPPPPVARSRRDVLRRSTMTFTLGSWA